MQYIPQIAFFILLVVTVYIAWIKFGKIRRNILLGKDINLKDRPKERLKQMLLIAFGQKKMFDRPIPAILHFFIYAGFILVNIEILEIILDGLLGTHRLFEPFLGQGYQVVIGFFEFFAVAVILACVVFLIRRNIIRLRRFHNPEMQGWPYKDGNYILYIEIALMAAFLTMNGTDLVIQQKGHDAYHQTGSFLFSRFLTGLFSGMPLEQLVILERTAWWVHIIGVFFFLNYLPNSKHLHIILAFPNTYFSKLEGSGSMTNMPEITHEVKNMLGIQQEGGNEEGAPPDRFGAKDATDLTWKNLLDAYACTECGRCTSECPANQTGKKLSPRKIMMDTRDRVRDIGHHIDQNGKDNQDDGKALLGDYITEEELNACTTCQACIDACPVNIDPLDIIYQLRRYKAMEESSTPQAWNMMFTNIENNSAPWKFPHSDRFKWAEQVKSSGEQDNNKANQQ